jgi:RES domain
MNCCAGCFGDRFLRGEIPFRSKETGSCSYCNSENVAVLPPPQLAYLFERLIGAYKLDPDGKVLVQLFREDWGMFDHQRMDNSRAKDLLAEIMNDGEIVRRVFSPASDFAANQVSEWENLREELMHRNRFFPVRNIDLERLEILFDSLKLEPAEAPRRWYRARIQTGEAPFTVANMGAPPNNIPSHGRANPAGIPYLYLGSTRDTAISEIRPHTGEIVCVADFSTPDNLTLVDLRSPRKTISPFSFDDAADIGRVRSEIPFLERLGEELTRPVVPQAAAIDYTPSQYLCEFIKKCGYNGVLYRSSVSDGMNLALFDPAFAKAGAVTQYRVTRVSVDVEAAGV